MVCSAAELARDAAEGEIFGAEVVAPLRDAMRLVDRQQRDVGLGQQLDRVGPRQPLGRDVEQAQLAPAQQPEDARVLGRLVAGIEAAGRDAGRAKRPTWSRISAISGETTRVRPGRTSAGS